MQITLRQFVEISHANALARRALASVVSQEEADSPDFQPTQTVIDAISHALDALAEEARTRFENSELPMIDFIEHETLEQRSQRFGNDAALLYDAGQWLRALAKVSGNHTPDFWLSD